MDAVVCNPPYIASIRLQKDRAYLVESEPQAAFDGGPFGISVQIRLIKESLLFLRPGGWLFFEFGLGQDPQVRKLLERAEGYDIVDFAQNQKGEARVSLNRKKCAG
jgi:release factor glutamine methyltransferase